MAIRQDATSWPDLDVYGEVDLYGILFLQWIIYFIARNVAAVFGINWKMVVVPGYVSQLYTGVKSPSNQPMVQGVRVIMIFFSPQ